MSCRRMNRAIEAVAEELGIDYTEILVGPNGATVVLDHCHDLRRWAEVMPARVRTVKAGILQAQHGWLTLKHEHSSICGLQRRAAA